MKKDELERIGVLQTPRLYTAGRYEFWERDDGKKVLHVSREMGYDGGIPRPVTECGRVLVNEQIYHRDFEEDSRVRICPRCGSLEDFREVYRLIGIERNKDRALYEVDAKEREAKWYLARVWRSVGDSILEEARAHPDELITVRVGDILDLIDWLER